MLEMRRHSLSWKITFIVLRSLVFTLFLSFWRRMPRLNPAMDSPRWQFFSLAGSQPIYTGLDILMVIDHSGSMGGTDFGKRQQSLWENQVPIRCNCAF